jgi:hypothetical protein
MMPDILVGLGGVGLLIVVLLFGLVGILMPFSMYAAQKWAYRTYQELEKLNQKFDELLALTREATRPSANRVP